MKVLKPVMEGIKESFKLSAAIILAVGAVLSAFTHHALNQKDRIPPADSASVRHKVGAG